MNSELSPLEPISVSASPAVIQSAPDDDFDDEVLGEREGRACSMEPGCPSCE